MMKNNQSSLPSDRELVKQARDGNRKAFDQLMLRYKPKVDQFLFYRLHDYQYEKDKAQDGWLKAYEKIMNGEYDERKTFWAWLKKILSNSIIDDIRKDKLYVHHHPELVTGYEKNASRNDAEEAFKFRDLVNEYTEHMPEPKRSIVRMRVLDGTLYKEIAKALGISTSDVGVTMYRVKKQMAKDFHLDLVQKLWNEMKRKHDENNFHEV